MKPGDLVRHRGNKEVYLILKTREVKGEVAYEDVVATQYADLWQG